MILQQELCKLIRKLKQLADLNPLLNINLMKFKNALKWFMIQFKNPILQINSLYNINKISFCNFATSYCIVIISRICCKFNLKYLWNFISAIKGKFYHRGKFFMSFIPIFWANADLKFHGKSLIGSAYQL